MAGRKAGVNHYDYVMNDGAQTFANLIRTAREAKGWSQEQLEQATGTGGAHVSVSTISRWERGQAGRPEPEHVRKVCKALGIDPRRAAVALGYLTEDEIGPPLPLDPKVKAVLDMIEDPALPAAEREQWIGYLKYLYDRARQQAG